MSIELPESVMALVERIVASGEYPSAGAYIEALIEDDQERRRQAINVAFGLTDEDRARINAVLDERMKAPPGSGILVDKAWLEDKLERLRERRTAGAAGQNPS